MLKSGFQLLRTLSRKSESFGAPLLRYHLFAPNKAGIQNLYHKINEEEFEYNHQIFSKDLRYLQFELEALRQNFREDTLAYVVNHLKYLSKTRASDIRKDFNKLNGEIAEILKNNAQYLEKPNTITLVLRNAPLVEKISRETFDQLVTQGTLALRNNYSLVDGGRLFLFFVYTLARLNVAIPTELIDTVPKNSLKFSITNTCTLLSIVGVQEIQHQEFYQKLLENLKIGNFFLMSNELNILLFLWSLHKIHGDKFLAQETYKLLVQLINSTTKNIHTRRSKAEIDYFALYKLISIVEQISPSSFIDIEGVKSLKDYLKEPFDDEKIDKMANTLATAILQMADKTGDTELRERIKSLKF